MSLNPFTADAEIATRRQNQESAFGDQLRRLAADVIEQNQLARSADLGYILTDQNCTEIMQRFDLTDKADLMCLLIGQAARLADPPISDFYVGAVGEEAETGHLVLGGNLEFPNTQLATTVHGEGFVMARAFSRGTTIRTIALSEAHPCGHCRQFLSEFAGAHALKLIDPLGHCLSLSQLLPWPFSPDALGQAGAQPGTTYFLDLELKDEFAATIPDKLNNALTRAGQKAYAPYSNAPAAVALGMGDGAVVTGMSLESVAFNPSLTAAQTSLINSFANGYGIGDIADVYIVGSATGPLNIKTSLASVFQTLAPKASIHLSNWSEQT
ncbi:MAG: cytidine deaminase [Marinosulfonomonas sp.]